MGSTLIISGTRSRHHSVLMPSRFELEMQAIIKQLNRIDVSFANKIAQLTDNGELSIVSFEELDSREILLLSKVVDSLLNDLILDNPELEALSPLFLAEFKALLGIDPRNNTNALKTVEVTINKDFVWKEKRWVIELIVECLLFRAQMSNLEIPKQLMDHRLNRSASYDFSFDIKEGFCNVRKLVERLTQHFDDKKRGRIGFSEIYNPILYDTTRYLAKLLEEDVRAKRC